MKKLAHKISLVVVLLFISSALLAKGKRAEKEKLINELIVLKGSEKIEVNTKFGELKINTWDKNEVAVKISIRVKDGNEKRAQELIDRIDVNISHTPSKLSIKTDISGDDDKIKIKTNKDGYLEINYELTVPKNHELDVKNAFGAFILGNMTANVTTSLKFGAATIGELNGEDNDLSFEFSDPIVISKINGGKIDLKFSKLELSHAGELNLSTEMSSSDIEAIETAVLDLKFGSLSIDDVKILNLDSKMSAVKIGTIQQKAKIEQKYGALSILNILKGIEQLDVDGEFSPMKITLEKGGNYNVNAISKMSGLKLPDGSIESEKPAQTKKPAIDMNTSFIGRIGEKNDNSPTLNITSSFGEVKIMTTD